MREARADLTYLRRLAFDALQRPPSRSEIQALLGMPVDRVSRQVWRRQEALEQWLEEELYFHLLIDRFRPRNAAMERLPQRLARGEASARDATAEILLSTGFALRNPGNDTFATVVLEQCLGMTVQDRKSKAELGAAKAMYDGRKARLLGVEGDSQADIVRIVLDRPEFAQTLLDRHHRRLFGARLDSRGKDALAAATAAAGDGLGRFFEVLAQWCSSPEYLAALATRRPRTHYQIVRGLYFDVLGRAPSYDETRNTRNALSSMADPTPMRIVLARILVDSPKAILPGSRADGDAAFVRAAFEHYLGRPPTSGESARFVNSLQQGGAAERHVARALLASVEYGYY
ncbi:MAG: hypothetical protein AB7I19_02530 [Planctomycetota bacterium]